MLTDREVGLDVSGLPRGGYQGAAAERLARESELARRGGLPGALDPGDPLRLHWQDLEALPRLDGQAAQALAGKGAGANRFTEGLLWLVLQEALDFVGQGVLLLDLMQEGAMGLAPGHGTSGGGSHRTGQVACAAGRWPRRWRCSTCPPGKHSRLVAAMRAYQQADRAAPGAGWTEPRAGGAGPGDGKAGDGGSGAGEHGSRCHGCAEAGEEPAQAEDPVEDTAYFQLRTRVEELLSGLEEVEREILKRRFGLDGRKAMSLEETARDMGLDPEEAAAREREAMCALRNGKG